MKLHEAYSQACAYWDSLGTSSRMMSLRAKACMDLLPQGGSLEVSQLGPAQAAAILAGLSNKGLSRATAASYYAAFKRMVVLAGGVTYNWPKAPKAPRVNRNVETMGVDYARLLQTRSKLIEQGHESTALLLELLMGSGMRVDVEALDWKAWKMDPVRSLLKVTGKGGHYREVPVGHALLRSLEERAALITSMKRVPYNTHYKRLRAVDPGLGFHDVRRWYATNAYKKSGKDIRVVQALLGHADISTTAGYIGVSVDDLRHAVSNSEARGACDE